MGLLPVHAAHSDTHGAASEQACRSILGDSLHRVGLAHGHVGEVAFLRRLRHFFQNTFAETRFRHSHGQ